MSWDLDRPSSFWNDKPDHPAWDGGDAHSAGRKGGGWNPCPTCVSQYDEQGSALAEHEKRRLSSAEFYHGSDHSFRAGDKVLPSAELIRSGVIKHMANPTLDLDERQGTTSTFATGTPEEAATWGRHVYRVEPMRGAKIHGDDNEYEVGGHMTVLGHLSPEQFGRTR